MNCRGETGKGGDITHIMLDNGGMGSACIDRVIEFFKCTNDDCGNTRKLLKNGEPAPPRADPVPMPHLKCEKVDDHYLLRDGASGIFLAASQFPATGRREPLSSGR